jgi:2-desacetyl-2-hydroxyethyl bacteriochlorophyllide A dehydrogenase
MKCLWLEDQKLRLRDLPRPVASPEEVLIRVRLAGICRTDQELVRGYYPFAGILGHEFVGTVVESFRAPKLMGKRVVGEINIACHDCPACRAGRRNHCQQRTVLGIADRHGAFAEYLVLPRRNLHVVPSSVPDEAAVFAEPLAAALEIRDQVAIKTADRVLVIGAGRLGQLIARVLALTGCNLHVVARYPRQAELLVEAGIATIEPADIREHSQDLVVEATGAPDGFELARRAVRPRGTIVLKSTYKGEIQVDFSTVVVNELTLIGSRCGPFSPALQMLERELVDPRKLIEKSFPLVEGTEAFEHAGKSGALKVLLVPNESGVFTSKPIQLREVNG